jgi:putative DNA primase/helicase
MSTETLAYALAYAARGWRVFPLRPGSKLPALKGWPDRATTDEDQIRRWFTGTKHGIGIATGPGSGLLVIDVDMKEGRRGDLSLDALQDDLGELPASAVQITPTGGQHRLYAYPAGRSIRNGAGIRDGIDTRGAGGFIVAAPTAVQAGEYAWDDVDTAADVASLVVPALPDPWVRLFETKIEPQSRQAKAVSRSLKSGARNETLTRHAGWLRREGHEPAAIAAALLAINSEVCDPPLPAQEVRAIAGSVSRYAPGRDLAEVSPRDILMTWADRMLAEPATDVMLGFDEVEPAAQTAAAEDPVWWTSFLDLLMARGAGRSAVAAVRKSAKPPKADRPKAEPSTQDAGADFSDAALPPGYQIPHGYSVTRDAVLQHTDDDECVTIAHAPIFIDALYRDGDTDREAVRLVWYRRGEWVRRVVPRSTVAVTRDLANLAEYGLPVTSVTAGRLAQYLAAVEAENEQRIPQSSVTERCGWHGSAFVLPGETVGGSSPTWSVTDDGMRQLGATVASAGDAATWRQIAQRAAEFPWVRLALAAALVAPYLERVGAANFLVDFGGRTSSGKTTALRLAASCWGSPDEAEGRSYLRSWSATRTAIERTAALLSCLPTILDETKRATGPGDALGSICYDLASGQGRGRGTTTGLQRTTATRTVVLTSGEQPLLELTTHQGLVGRVVQVTGSPFGDDDQRVLVETIREVTDAHYGWAGPQVVRALVDDRPDLTSQVRECRRELQSSTESTDPLIGRLCAHYAVLAVCGQHALDTVGIDADVYAAVRAHLALTDRAMGGRDQARLALELVMDLPVTQPDAIDEGDGSRAPAGGYIGMQCEAGLVFHPEPLRRYLAASGFRPGEVLTIWSERGWIDGEDGRTTKKVRVGSRRPRCIVPTRMARDVVEAECEQAEVPF